MKRVACKGFREPVPAKRAEDFQIGDVIMYGSGYSVKVVGRRETPKMVVFDAVESQGKRVTQGARKGSLLAIGMLSEAAGRVPKRVKGGPGGTVWVSGHPFRMWEKEWVEAYTEFGGYIGQMLVESLEG